MAAEAHAARLHDPVAHSHALAGFLAGAVVGFVATLEAAAVIGAVVGAVALEVGTAGLATPLVIGVAATVAEVGLTVVAGGVITNAAQNEGEKEGSESLGDPTGAVAQGSPNVLINGLPAARATDQESCHSGKIAQGSQTVGINGLAAARVGDKTTCGAVISLGSANVLIGGPTGTFLSIQSEIPSSVRWAVLFATIAISLGSAAREIGPMLAEINETGLARALQTGAKALKTSLEEKGGGGVPSTPSSGMKPSGSATDAATIATRRATAQDFYAKQNWPQSRIDAHMKGIDFNQPVEVVPIEAGTSMSQWQTPGGSKGDYFASDAETPGSLGISTVGYDPNVGAVSKVRSSYTSDAPTSALKTTAAPMNDNWSNPYAIAQTNGGGTQYFIPTSDVFQPAGH